jgi:hypothetical protein
MFNDFQYDKYLAKYNKIICAPKNDTNSWISF